MIEPKLVIYKKNDNLTILEKDACPFPIKRVFFIQNVRKLAIRGNHAHKFCEQVIFPLAGAFEIDFLNIAGTCQYTLDSTQNYGVHVPAMNWLKIRILRPKTVVGVLCSLEYDEQDYIRDMNDYQNSLQQLRTRTS